MKQKKSLKKIALWTFGLEILGISIVIAQALIMQTNPMLYFGENGFVTWLSIVQLFIISYLSWKISRVNKFKNKISRASSRKKLETFWLIAAIGMFFMALDEWLQIHENLDKAILNFLNIEINDFTGRLDDFIILFYAICGLLIIYWYRNELQNYRDALPWFFLGLLFCFLTIFMDMLGHNRATFSIFADNIEELNHIHHWFTTFEEIPKIFSEGAFILTLCKCLKITQNKKRSQISYDKSYSKH